MRTIPILLNLTWYLLYHNYSHFVHQHIIFLRYLNINTWGNGNGTRFNFSAILNSFSCSQCNNAQRARSDSGTGQSPLSHHQLELTLSPSQLWDTRTQKLVANLNCRTGEDTEFLYCAQFYSSDKVICGGSGIKDAKLIDTTENQVSTISNKRYCGADVLSGNSVNNFQPFSGDRRVDYQPEGFAMYVH